MELHEAIGCEVKFSYPQSGQNRACVRSALVRRHVHVHDARDTFSEPLHPRSLQERPDLRRSGWLVTCWDLERSEWRSFYNGAVRNLLVVSRAESPDSLALSERQCHVLVAMVEAGAVNAANRLTIDAIARLAEGPFADSDSFKRPISQLVSRDLLTAKRGRGGGCWVTKIGKRFAEGLAA